MKKPISNKGHQSDLKSHIDGLGTISIVFGIACVGFILYNVFHVILS
jgi:hypothetical protein